MRVATAGGVGPAVSSVGIGSEIMPVVGDRLDMVVGVGIEMLARLALVPAALNHVIEMGNDAGGDEHLAARVEVDSPRVARAVGEDFKVMPQWVVPPDGGVQRDSIGSRGSRLPNPRMREHAVA